MPLSVEVSESDAQDLIDFYVAKQQSVRNQIQALEGNLKDLNWKISELKLFLKGIKVIDKEEMEQYSNRWSWVKKIQFIIEKAGKPLTTKEIVDMLTDYDPAYIANRRTAIASVSATLSNKSGTYEAAKEFVKIPSDWGDFTYDVWKEKTDDETQKAKLEEAKKDFSNTKDEDDDLPF